jgi:RNA recognition motif-containing protein
MSTSIYVGNLPYAVSEESLGEIFSNYGTVVSTKIVIDRDTGRSKGFGFVEMSTKEEADAAIAELENSEIDGRTIKINLARPKEERPRDGRRDGQRNFVRR